MAEEDKDKGKGKFTIPIWIPVILLIATIIHLFLNGKTLWEFLDIAWRMLTGDGSLSPATQAGITNTIITTVLKFVGWILLYVFLWGALYYLYKATGNKLFSKSSATDST